MILFIDDEKRYVENVISELQTLGFEVMFCKGVDDALSTLAERASEIEVMVCDLMMPHGRSFTADETKQNRETGIVFLKHVRQRGISTPAVLLTFVERGLDPESLAKDYAPCVVVRKREFFSFEIAEIIKRTIGSWKR